VRDGHPSCVGRLTKVATNTVLVRLAGHGRVVEPPSTSADARSCLPRTAQRVSPGDAVTFAM